MMTYECEQRQKLFLQVIIAQHYCCSKHSVLEHVQQNHTAKIICRSPF